MICWGNSSFTGASFQVVLPLLEGFNFWNLEPVGKGRVYVYSQLMVLKIKEPVLTLDRAVQKHQRTGFGFWPLTRVQRTYPKLPVLLPVLWNFSRALLLLKILYNPNQRFSDFEKFQKSDTSGSLIFDLKKKKTQEPKVLNKMKEPPNIGIHRQRAESLQSGLISCLFKANFYGVFCMWVVGGIGMTTTVQKLWCFSQPEAISHDGIPNLKRRDKTCTAIAMQGRIHNRTIIIWEVSDKP